MEKDLISGFDVKDVDRKMAIRNVRLALAILIMSGLYSGVDFIELIFKLIKKHPGANKYPHFFYLNKLLPVVSIFSLILVVATHLFYYRGFKQQSAAFDKDDSIAFNQGLRFFNIALILWTIYLSILIIRMLANFIILRY